MGSITVVGEGTCHGTISTCVEVPGSASDEVSLTLEAKPVEASEQVFDSEGRAIVAL